MLTPRDIENREFKKTLNGYNRDDVEDFMELILVDYEKLYNENRVLKEKMESLTESVDHYKAQESTMQNAIMAAQSAADNLTKSAEDRASVIVKEANIKANEILRAAQDEARQVKQGFAETRQQLENYKTRMKSIIKAQLDMIDGLNANENFVDSGEEADAGKTAAK